MPQRKKRGSRLKGVSKPRENSTKKVLNRVTMATEWEVRSNDGMANQNGQRKLEHACWRLTSITLFVATTNLGPV